MNDTIIKPLDRDAADESRPLDMVRIIPHINMLLRGGDACVREWINMIIAQ